MICTVAAGGRVEPGKHFVGARLQCISRQNCDRLAKSHVARRFAAAQIVVVQCRKVIVNQRVRVQHLERRAQPLDSLRQLSGDCYCSLHCKHRTQPLAARKRRVPHRSMD